MSSNNTFGDNPFLHNNDNYSGRGYDPYNNTQYKAGVDNSKADSIKHHKSSDQLSQQIENDSSCEILYYQPLLVSWSGRIGRLRFFVFNLVLGISYLILQMLIEFSIYSSVKFFFAGIFLTLLVINFTFFKRRLNDLNKNGWFTLLYYIPIINFIFFLYLLLTPGTPSPNRYGAMPIPANNTLMWMFAILGIIANGMLIHLYASKQMEYGYNPFDSAHYSQSADFPENYNFDEFGDIVSESDGNVILYATKWCNYCRKTREFLSSNNIDYIEYDIESSAYGASEYRRLKGKGVPLLLINSTVIRGYNPRAIMAALDETGE